MKIQDRVGGINLELCFWIAAIFVLARLNPVHPPDFSLCLFRYLGLPCPGCGLGRSIAFLLHGDLIASVRTHPLGLPALMILSARIISLLRIERNRIRAPQPKTLT